MTIAAFAGRNVEELLASLKENDSILVNEVPENYSHPVLYATDEG